MATLPEKLAESLEQLKKLQEQGKVVIKSADLTKTHLSRLVKNGFLQEVMRGWYILSRPDLSTGDSTSWYASYWVFVAEYATQRFKNDWSLSPEQSLSIHGGDTSVPRQLIIRSSIRSNGVLELIHKTSLVYYNAKLASPIETVNGLNLYSLPEALIECRPDFFQTDSVIARTCLSLLQDASDILRILLDRGHTTKAGRLAGAFRNIGNTAATDQIISTMKSVGHDVREEDPFSESMPIPYQRETSPYVARIKFMWNSMREVVINNFPKTDHKHTDIETCMQHIEEIYRDDAYNSLSIEGYRVTNELIERVRSGSWNPDADNSDKQQKDAMAARGYYQCFEAVKSSIRTILGGDNPGTVASKDHRIWYQELFAPSVAVGLMKAGDLAGYRNEQVYINNSMHTPLNPQAVRDVMPVFFELLESEPDSRVRIVLGHFVFVYIHPYKDGNGRIARFLMNTMLIAGGYQWVIVPLERRREYMSALETASVDGGISDFCLFIASLLNESNSK